MERGEGVAAGGAAGALGGASSCGDGGVLGGMVAAGSDRSHRPHCPWRLPNSSSRVTTGRTFGRSM